jgi:FkbM family methyltransferase
MLKHTIKRILQKSHIWPLRKTEEYIYPKWRWLGSLDIRTILNIGSNEGQFALELRKNIPGSKIYAFEPIPGPFQKLKENFANDPNFKAFPYALGKTEGVAKMFLNEYSPSSSFLEMGDNHKSHFDFAKKEYEIEVEIRKLDNLAAQLEISNPLLITLDVQGFEMDVISGGLAIIYLADIIITEVSFIKLYKQQPLFSEVYNMLTSLNFEYAGNFEQLTSPVNGAVLQADAIFIKKGSPEMFLKRPIE